jgi:hypothetical protein
MEARRVWRRRLDEALAKSLLFYFLIIGALEFSLFVPHRRCRPAKQETVAPTCGSEIRLQKSGIEKSRLTIDR